MDTGTYKTRHTLIFEVLITVLTLFVFFLSVFFSEEVFASNQYTVSNAEEFNAAVTEIAAGDEQEATIALAADITGQNEFHGISGKKITITSDGNETRSLAMHHVVTLQGDVVLDHVKLSHTALTDIFACGHLFETTENFEGFIGTHDYIELYGGGPEGQNVEGDTHIILRGKGDFTDVTGGGLNSNVSGSTNILIDDFRIETGALTGGGIANKSGADATVGGNTNITLISGRTTDLVGGGRNETGNDSRDIARVYGDTNITVGAENAESFQAVIGSAMPCYGGSYMSTVSNVHFTILPGTVNYNPNLDDFTQKSGPGELFGAGTEDIVLGTVELVVKGGGCGSRIKYIYGASETAPRSSSGVSEVLNQDGKENAIHIIYENDDIAANVKGSVSGHDHNLFAVSDYWMDTEVNGNILVEIKNGDFDEILLDSENQRAVVKGDSTAVISGGRAAYIYGTMKHWSDAEHNSRVIYDGCGTSDAPQETGQLGVFENVYLKNGAQVSIDSNPELFPSDFSEPDIPFYFVKNLQIEEESKLTTRNSSTTLRGAVSMDNGTWHALGYVYVYEGTESKDSHIFFDNYFALGYNHRNDEEHSHEFTAWKSENDEMLALNCGYRDKIYGNVEFNGSELTLLSPVDVRGNWTDTNTLLRLPAVENNYDGTDDGGEIAVNIDGEDSSTCDILVVVPNNTDGGHTAQKPKLGDNYITGWKANGAAHEVFLLDNEDAIKEGLYLKCVEDVKPSHNGGYYMWQVAKLDARRVKYEYKGDIPEGAPNLPEEKEYYWRMKVDLEDEPDLEGYTFSGWESEDVEITDKSQLRMATANKAFEMPDKDVTISGTWTKDDPSDPDDKEDSDSPDDKETPENPDSPSDQKTPDNPDSPSDTDTPDKPNSSDDRESPNSPNSQGSTATTEDTDTTDDSDSTSDSDTTDDSKDKASTATKKSPKTSDDNYLMLYAAIMLIAMLGETAIFVVRKRN